MLISIDMFRLLTKQRVLTKQRAESRCQIFDLFCKSRFLSEWNLACRGLVKYTTHSGRKMLNHGIRRDIISSLAVDEVEK